MATGIPLPGNMIDTLMNGVKTGSNFYTGIMNPILEREKQKQLGEQFGITNKRLAEQFAQQQALRKQQEARLGSLTNLQRQELMYKIENLKDPTKKIRMLYDLANAAQNQNQDNGVPATTQQPNNEALHQKLQSMGMFGQQLPQQQGVMPLQEQEQQPEYPVEQIQQQPQGTQNTKPNLMQMIVGGMLHKETGYNPFAPEKGSSYTGAAREGLDMSRLKQQFGENSEEYKNAQSIQHAKEQRNEDLSEIRHRQLNGLKPGDTEITDQQTGQTIGFRKQTTDKQKDAAKNTVLFNHLFPLVQGSAKLSGPGATARFEQAARTYKTNPESRKIIDDLLIADRAASTTAVTEASRFNAGHQLQTFNRLIDTLKSEDIPKKLKKWIKEYEIPAEANIKADKRWQEELNKAEKLANSRIPATMDYYFDPDKQFAHEQQMANGNSIGNGSDFSQMSDEELNAIVGGG